MVGLMFLLSALTFAGIVLIFGYLENKNKGYNMPFDEEKEKAQIARDKRELKQLIDIIHRFARPKKWIYKHPGD